MVCARRVGTWGAFHDIEQSSAGSLKASWSIVYVAFAAVDTSILREQLLKAD
jgi:hypothetical protein